MRAGTKDNEWIWQYGILLGILVGTVGVFFWTGAPVIGGLLIVLSFIVAALI